MTTDPIDRRAMLRGAAALGVGGLAVGALAACSDAAEAPADASSPPQPTSAGTTPAPSTGSPEPLVAVADVPVGGGVVISEADVVVTQPEAGTVVGFSSVCTHQGCPVAEVVDGAIVCNCHGSQFSIADGSVLQGPATAPLPGEQVTVRGGSVFLA